MIQAVYSTQDGRIDRIVVCPSSDIGIQAKGGESCIEVDEEVSDSTHFVDIDSEPYQIHTKSALSYSTHSDGLLFVLEGLPESTRVYVSGEELLTDGDPTEIEVDVPGVYYVELYPPPQYMDEVVEVTVG